MAPLTESHSKNEIKEALDEIEVYVTEEDTSLNERRKQKFFAWGISGLCHLAAILIFAVIIFAVKPDNEEQPPMRIAVIDKLEIKVEKERQVEQKENIEINIDKPQVENPIVSQLDTLIDINSSEDYSLESTVKGNEEAISNVEIGQTGVFTSIGSGGGSSGILGNRNGKGKMRARGQLGSQGKAVDSGIDAGLRWLKRHQSPINGMWDANNYTKNCEENPKCEPGVLQSGDTNIALTSLSILSYLGAGYDHKTPNKYKKVVEKGLSFLLSSQKNDGLFGERNYEHAMATMALSEAYAMTNDISLQIPAQKALNVLLSRQNKPNKNDPYSGFGWDYNESNINRTDTSVSGWAALSLKSGMAGGLNVKNGLDGVKNWLDSAWKDSNPEWRKIDIYGKSTFPYTYDAISNKSDKDHLSAVGALCAVFTGHHAGDIMFESLLNDAKSRWIDTGEFKNNDYITYYLSLSMFQAGKDKWSSFLNTVMPYILSKQRKNDGCFDGSWDYDSQRYHGKDAGRILSTCFNLLSVEVAYRYTRIK